jgi:hypothetical protein
MGGGVRGRGDRTADRGKEGGSSQIQMCNIYSFNAFSLGCCVEVVTRREGVVARRASTKRTERRPGRHAPLAGGHERCFFTTC